MSEYHLAQLNIAKARGPLDSPEMADFVANLDRINALAESSPGFVWRLEEDVQHPDSPRAGGPDMLVNLSVWRDTAALNDFVYRSGHLAVMRRRREWFERMAEAYMVLWWVPRGHQPTVEEALERLQLLRRLGPGSQAFTFRDAFPPPDAAPAAPASFPDQCPA